MHVIVRVYVVEGEASGAKAFKLGADFGRELTSDGWQKKISETRAHESRGECAIAVDEVGDGSGR